MTFEAKDFRRALGCFATGITVVTTVVEGRPLGVTVNSFNSVSLDPPLVLFSLGRGGSALAAFQAARHFVVNVLRHDQQDLSDRFASRAAAPWTDVPYETWETGCPVLQGVLSVFECDLESTVDGGDHVIFLGRVRNIACAADGEPLLYFRGGYTRLAD